MKENIIVTNSIIEIDSLKNDSNGISNKGTFRLFSGLMK